MFTNTWTNIKAWFKHSWTLFITRIEVVTGLIIAGIAAVDWSPIFAIFGTGTAFTQKELLSIGGVVFIRGIVGEIARRHNTVDVGDRLVPIVDDTPVLVAPTDTVVIEVPKETLK